MLMQRSARITVAVVALLLLVAGTAFATRSVVGDEHRSPVAATHQPSSLGDDVNEPSEAPETTDNQDKDTQETNTEDSGAQLTDDHASALVDLLSAQGIDATADELKTLAAKYGVGGAVRLEAWASATNMTAGDLASMFDDSGLGWGAFAQQLTQNDSSLDVSPGIGWIMGHGHGHDHGAGASNAGHGQGHAKHSS